MVAIEEEAVLCLDLGVLKLEAELSKDKEGEEREANHPYY